MEIQKFTLTPPYKNKIEGLSPTLTYIPTAILPENNSQKRPAVIVCPGGAYYFCSYREGIPVALRYAAYGIAAFVLEYSVVEKPFPTALTELAEAIAFVRKHADEWNIDPNMIYVEGFSAGGHLACSLGVHHNSEFLKNLYPNDNIRPDGIILCYPVITSGEYKHEGSIYSLLGGNPSESDLQTVSLEKNVDESTPPTFIWHCSDDDCVPVENSLLFMSALSKNKIKFEGHIYDHGGHGMGLGDDCGMDQNDSFFLNEDASQWFNLSLRFIRRLSNIKYR